MVHRSIALRFLSLALCVSIGFFANGAMADEESREVFSTISKARDMAHEDNFKGAEQTFKTIGQKKADDLAIEYKRKFREKLDELAGLFLKKKLYTEAEGLYLSRLEEKKEDYTSDEARFLANIALINLAAGKEAEAVTFNSEALKIALKECGTDNLEAAKEGKKKSEKLLAEGHKKEALEETLLVCENILKRQERVNFNSYMSLVQKTVRANWNPPKSESSKHVNLRFKIFSDGSVSRLKVLKSGGHSESDAAAIKAVEKSTPFAPLPKYAPHSVDIEFSLDYNVH
ncbi:MAG: TonB family protein [Candidatus Melainabacteria bacterium]|nr:MAG: TonB family protein [Candidatus Melainabacteria bacterium]